MECERERWRVNERIIKQLLHSTTKNPYIKFKHINTMRTNDKKKKTKWAEPAPTTTTIKFTHVIYSMMGDESWVHAIYHHLYDCLLSYIYTNAHVHGYDLNFEFIHWAASSCWGWKWSWKYDASNALLLSTQ